MSVFVVFVFIFVFVFAVTVFVTGFVLFVCLSERGWRAGRGGGGTRGRGIGV